MKILAQQFNYCWRVIAVRFCFFWFGVGGLFLGYLILPLLRLFPRDPVKKHLNAQYVVSLTFRLFVFLMEILGIVKFHFNNFERLQTDEAHFIVGNHPTLIDYVVIASRLKNCYTLLKADASQNPFMRKVIRMTGYISNADADQAYQQVQQVLENGQNLLVFPEGTRTTAGQALKLHRGAANIALRLNMPIRIIRINCPPRFLTKACKWYTVPRRKVQFTVEVGELVEVESLLAKKLPLSIAARQLTELLTKKLEGTTHE